MRTPSVRIIAEQDSAEVGERGFEPTLAETITSAGRTLGQILVGPRQRSPFSAAEAEKLRHYTRLIGHLLDAAERQHQWQSLALIDPVTQLPNRRYLQQRLELLLHRAAGDRSRVTVLIFDLDGFKHFNDCYGHSAGDDILRETGQLFRRCCRQDDIVARYAGDEFVVVFWDAEQPRIPGSKHPTDALAVLRRFKRSLQSHEFPKLGSEAKGRITISGGLASFPWDAKDAQGLIDRADEALLQAKQAGKNRIVLVGTEGQTLEEATGDSLESSR
jgi:diguanylate cyclase (GGDEF)-like protein